MLCCVNQVEITNKHLSFVFDLLLSTNFFVQTVAGSPHLRASSHGLLVIYPGMQHLLNSLQGLATLTLKACGIIRCFNTLQEVYSLLAGPQTVSQILSVRNFY